jgi:hypothetical protein
MPTRVYKFTVNEKCISNKGTLTYFILQKLYYHKQQISFLGAREVTTTILRWRSSQTRQPK